MAPVLLILFSLVIWGVIFYVLWWGKGAVGIGEPWDKGITVLLVLASIYVFLGLLLGFVAPFPFLLGLA